MGEGSVQLYSTLKDTIAGLPQNAENPDKIIAPLLKALNSLVPPAILDEASKQAKEQWQSIQVGETSRNRALNTVDAFLYAILCGDQHLHQLHDYLVREPSFLQDVAHHVFSGDENAEKHLVTLVDLAVRARPTSASLSLLPARYHAFARALEGVFACMNRQNHADGLPHLFLSRHETCPDCSGQVVELATCVRCGATYVVGRKVERRVQGAHFAPKQYTLHQLTELVLESSDSSAYFLLNELTGYTDEDELTATGEESADQGDIGALYRLCLRCGNLLPQDELQCSCGGSTIILQEMDLRKNQEEPKKCIHCGSRSTSTIIFRFLTGQDAPVSVLATALYQNLPSSIDPDAKDLPGRGRKLLIFSDSRQDAAFFAPYLERTYNQVLQRHLILSTLLSDKDGRDGTLRLQDMSKRLLREAEHAGMFRQRQSRDERLRLANIWLMQEAIALDRRLSLEGVGLLFFRLVRPQRWRPPAALQNSPWNLHEEECWTLIALMLDTLRYQGVTTFLEDLDPRDVHFAPRNYAYFVRQEQADSKVNILSWTPTRGTNRRQDLLERLLQHCAPALPPEQRQERVTEALKGIWNHLTEPASCWHDHFPSTIRSRSGVVYRLSHEFWELVPLTDAREVYRCNRCRAYTSHSFKGLCPTLGCQGTLEACNAETLLREENHYRAVYLGMHALPLSAEEHTAQWTSSEAGKVQERFIRGEVNVLSCSTTFELGVDVGELQSVLMRNVPPTTANYVQRAGRAGRRTDSAAFALTYAQRRSHDLTHYSNPKRIVAGHVSPPQIMLANEKIIRRHMQAVLLATFLRQIHDSGQRLFRTVGDFFQPENDLISGTKLLLDFAEAHPNDAQAALRRIVPADFHSNVGVEDWSWLRTAEDDGMLDLLERVDAEVTEDLDLYRRSEDEAARERLYGQSQHYQQVIRTIRSRSLLGFFASRNLLPKYGFPTDVVELKTDHLSEPDALRVQLERDLRIALSEYAPGAEVVAAKHIWRGGGLYKQPKRDWPIFRYAICSACKRFLRCKEEEDIGTVCSCGSTLQHRGKTFVIPEFGFVAARNAVRVAGESRPQRLYASRVYFTEYSAPDTGQETSIIPSFETVEVLSSADIHISRYYSRFGKLALVNEGLDRRGFRICQRCGFAEMAPALSPGRTKQPTKSKSHVNPLTGKACEGFTQTHHLGHEFLTDVVEIRLDGRLARMGKDRLWRSLLYALLEGASQALQIRRDDLDGTLYYPSYGEAPALMLFDNVPGGAGHVQRISREMQSVFLAAYERVKNECCGPETSCYECLRNYRNQSYHGELERGVVRDFLCEVLAAAREER